MSPPTSREWPMRFNLAEHRRLYVGSGSYKVLTESELALLVDGDTDTVSISVTGETFAVVCDLGARYRLDEVLYYHQAASVENVVFYGKQGAGAEFSWVELTHTDDGQRLSVDLAGLSDRYEFLRVVHTAITGTAEVYELEILSSAAEIQFGDAAEITVFSVDSGTSILLPERVSIYNPDDVSHTFYCLLEAEDVDSSGLRLGPTSSGVFSGLYETGVSVSGTFLWSSGHFVDTVVSGTVVVLASGTSGFYYTPVIDVSSLAGRRFFWQAVVSGTNELDESGSIDSFPTAGVRLSNVAPTDGGWVSGQLSVDSNWDVDTGVLSFEPYDNNHILNPKYSNYFQARVEFYSPAEGQTPRLERIGIEEAFPVTVAEGTSGDIYVKSAFTEHVQGRESKLVVWYLESRNKEQ